jgi:D-3-phosphoglycerate dehydrogenase
LRFDLNLDPPHYFRKVEKTEIMLSQRPSFTTTMTAAIAIPGAHGSPQVVATSISPSTSTFHDRLRRGSMASDGAYNIRIPKVLHPIDNDHLKLLVLENISQEAVAAFTSQGFHVDHFTKAMSEDELVEKIPNYHAIGIRSKTKITERVIKAASKVRVR